MDGDDGRNGRRDDGSAAGGGDGGRSHDDDQTGDGARRRATTAEDDRNGRICAKMKATTGTLLSAAAGTQLGRKMGLGLDGDVAPRSKIDAPRGSGAAQR